MKKKNIIISGIIFIFLIFITFFIIFHNYSFNTIYNNIKSVSIVYILICLILIILYFICQGTYFKLILKSENEDITLFKGIYYSIVEFFFSAITPSSTGGQPIQLYYMTKDKIPMRKSIIALILNTMIFKLFFVVGGILILIFFKELVFNNGLLIEMLFFLGLLIDILMIIGCLLLMYNQRIIAAILKIFYKLKNRLSKNKKDYNNTIVEILEKYVDEAKFINENKKAIVIAIIITFIQRILLFSITYVIYRSFRFNVLNYFEILLLQIFVQIACEGIILPGGVGVSEFISKYLFKTCFEIYFTSAMVICRTLSFYFPLIILLFIILIVTKKYYFQK